MIQPRDPETLPAPPQPYLDMNAAIDSPRLAGDRRVCLKLGVRFDRFSPAEVVETDDSMITIRGVDAPVLSRVLGALDGTRSLSQIAAQRGVPISRLESICNALLQCGIGVEVLPGAAPALTAEEFAALCARLFPIWKEQVFSHPLWVALTAGTASHSQFAGWVIETYHFIETVNSRLALAIAECPVPAAREMFAHHYTEEWDHHHFFMNCLLELGFSKERVLSLRPLPGTLAVVNCMRRFARQDALYYAACSGFLESTGEDRTGGRRFFELLIEHYCPHNPAVIKPMRAHLDLDEEYGHNGVLEEMGPHLGLLSRDRILGGLHAVMELVETLELWSDDILAHYARPSALDAREARVYRPLDGGVFSGT